MGCSNELKAQCVYLDVVSTFQNTWSIPTGDLLFFFSNRCSLHSYLKLEVSNLCIDKNKVSMWFHILSFACTLFLSMQRKKCSATRTPYKLDFNVILVPFDFKLFLVSMLTNCNSKKKRQSSFRYIPGEPCGQRAVNGQGPRRPGLRMPPA